MSQMGVSQIHDMCKIIVVRVIPGYTVLLHNLMFFPLSIETFKVPSHREVVIYVNLCIPFETQSFS